MRQAKLGDFLAKRSRGIVPASTPDESFELYSVPAFEGKHPEVVTGGQIGSNKQIVDPGTVLLCKINPRINRAWTVGSFTKHQKIASTEWITFPPHPDVEPRYLAHYLSRKEIRNYLAANASGVGGSLMRVKASTVEDLPLPLPSVDEQRRIVAEIEKQLSRLDEAVANLKRVKANLKRYKAAVLRNAVEGRLVLAEAERAGRHRRNYETGDQLLERITVTLSRSVSAAKKIQLPNESGRALPFDLPEGWSVATIAQLAEVVEYGSSAKTSEAYIGVPVLRMGNIVDGDLDLSTLKYLPDSHVEFPRLLLRAGDLLFNRTNSPELVGKTAVFKGRPEKCSFASYLIRVRLASGCMPEFVSAFINSVHGRKWVKAVATQQVGQANVNGTKLQNLLIPFPPIVEQERIVSELGRRLSVIGHAAASIDAKLQQATLLRETTLVSQLGAPVTTYRGGDLNE